jgi:uncharacterized protein (TIGR03083 family)
LAKDHINVPVDVVQLLPVLDRKLIALLKSLAPADWHKPTIAKLWTVKDVIAHLLDGNIRILSMLRDGYFSEHPNISSNQELVDFLNGLNADWVKAMRRVSPAMLILLHEATGHLYSDYYASLDPFEKSPFAVDWAGEKESLNWMHIAREYSEKWLHQQQVRDALNDAGLMTRELYYPFMDVFMLALPHTYRQVEASDGTIIRITIPGEIGGAWHLVRSAGKWVLDKKDHACPVSELIIDPGISWKLFSKSLPPEQVKDKIRIEGDSRLGEIALSMVSVMA